MNSTDRLYELLPAVYRQRDADQGYPLRALLRVISEQLDIVENDISQLYDNWFVESCEDWVVPYIGDLVGYRIVHEAGEPGDINTPEERERNKILIPRREVANTIRYRRRKGTLALLEELALSVAGWPARAVEFDRLVSFTQWINHPHPLRGRTADLRDVDALELLGTPFDQSSRTIDVRGPDSPTSQGTSNIATVGLFVWRLRSYPLTQTRACLLEEVGDNCLTFSILGNDVPLFNQPDPENEPTEIFSELDVPVPIRRSAFAKPVEEAGGVRYQASEKYYGKGKSISISTAGWGDPIPPEKIIPADLSDWEYEPEEGHVAVDPELGRIVFPSERLPEGDVWVSYSYGFSADIGGGPYRPPIIEPAAEQVVYTVGPAAEFLTIGEAYRKWRDDQRNWERAQEKSTNSPFNHAIIEITDSGLYEEEWDRLRIHLQENETLELRAANGVRPVLRLPDLRAARRDELVIRGDKGSACIFDGILVTGRGIEVEGNLKAFILRHSTLVPGWGLHHDCNPRRPTEPSLVFSNTNAHVRIEHSIIGHIKVNEERIQFDPLQIYITDSVIDGLNDDAIALNGPGHAVAPTVLTMQRCTVIGQVQTHAITLAENSIFTGKILVGRRQHGCMRFCYVPPDSRTPRRYECQPDLVDRAIEKKAKKEELDAERLRVKPQFLSTRYGKPGYCKLADSCAIEIKRGADDESEMGVFHDLFEPQREANLRARLGEYVPAGVSAGIIFAR